ncbi:MAG: hypothetical protein IT381_19215 [Deltaproteobacteria bacterium]|nr:hypothetical protein [Deltaproteobacteria bacterium]
MSDALLAMSARLLRDGDAAAAGDAAEVATLAAPEDARAWLLFGACAARRGMLERAVVAFRQACTLAPSQVESWLMLGEASLDLGDLAAGARALERAMTLDPRAEHPAGRRARALVARALAQLGG